MPSPADSVGPITADRPHVNPPTELDQLKSAFLASLNHEIRTPLSGLLGMTDLLLETSLDEEQREYASTAKLCAENLLHILNATLEYSALESGQVQLEHSEFSLKELLDSVLEQQAPHAQVKGLRLFSTVTSPLPETLIGDPGRIKQVLSHLLDNAIKFTHHGSIELHLSAVGPVEGRNDESVVLTAAVRDTGVGIPVAQRERIFDSFHQLEEGLSRGYAGLGLGLALVRKLLSLMDGEIAVVSEPGEGSTVTVKLPLRIPAPVAIDRKPSFGKAAVILAVDDNPVGMTVLKHALARHCLEVDSASDGRGAIEAASRRPYDLILMDLQMPEMDGLEATAHIRRLPGYQDVPIIALTADISDQTRQECLRSGMQGFITKPVDAGGLWKSIQRLAKLP